MKKIIAILTILILFLAQNGQSQGFVNLNFESASVSGYSPNSDNIPTTSALPGWSADYFNSSQTNAANMTPLQTFSNYTLYGGNIPSSLAGEMETLSFTEPPSTTGVQPSFFELDNIQFSTSPIPEPSELALVALGGLLFVWRRCKK